MGLRFSKKKAGKARICLLSDDRPPEHQEPTFLVLELAILSYYPP